MKNDTHAELVPPMAFTGAVRLNNSVRPSSAYASVLGTEHLLPKAIEFLGITRYQLGRLLDYAQPSHIYSLLSGRRRPSQLHVSRLAWLFLLRFEGYEPVRWRSINWETGEITLRTASRRRPEVRVNERAEGADKEARS
jgi:hypothetical protein